MGPLLVGALLLACARTPPPPVVQAPPPPPDAGVVAGARKALEDALASRRAREVNALFDPAMAKLRQWSQETVPRAAEAVQVSLTPAAVTGDEVLARLKLHAARRRGRDGQASYEQVVVVSPDAATGWKFREASPAAAEAIRRDGWRRDIAYLRDELPRRHHDPFARTPRAQFLGALAALESALPRLEDHQVEVGMMAAVAQLGDAHTRIDASFAMVGLQLAWFDDGVFVARAAHPHGDLRGARVLRVGTVPVDRAVERVRVVFAGETEARVRLLAPWYLAQPQVLHAAGLAARPDGVLYTLALRDGREVNVEIELPPADTELRWLPAPGAGNLRAQSPERPFWWKRVSGGRTVYLRYTSCRDPAAFHEMSDKLLALLDAHPPGKRGGVDRLIVDLRDNEGGDSAVTTPLVEGLERRRDSGLIVVALIGRQTFSSGVWAAYDLRKRAGALLVGEPTGGKPNTPGDVKSFTLPDSGLVVNHSTRYLRRDPGDGQASLMPDLPSGRTAADYLAGRDVTLTTALSWPPARGRAVTASRP
jgi:hypothetical protein